MRIIFSVVVVALNGGCSSIGSHTHADAGYKLIATMTIKGARAWRVCLTDKFKQPLQTSRWEERI